MPNGIPPPPPGSTHEILLEFRGARSAVPLPNGAESGWRRNDETLIFEINTQGGVGSVILFCIVVTTLRPKYKVQSTKYK